MGSPALERPWTTLPCLLLMSFPCCASQLSAAKWALHVPTRQQCGVQRLCWLTLVGSPPNGGGSCKEEEKKPKCLRPPKEERRAWGKVNIFVTWGQCPYCRGIFWDIWKTPEVYPPPGWNVGSSTVSTWWLWLMIWSLLRGLTVYWALDICLASEEDSNAQAHTLFRK